MSFDRKGKPKTESDWRRAAKAWENSRKLPHPDKEVHHYDMRVMRLPCPIKHGRVLMKLEGHTIRSCSLQSRCEITNHNWVLCLKGKHYCGRNGTKP